jgi:RNA polymerase primary sigma factor
VAQPAPRIPESEDHSLEIYLREIRRTRLLTPLEEIDLARRIRKGDRRAFEILVRSNLRFVVSIARGYVGRGMPLADLINEGNVGLMKAAERFDETRGFRFISYAIWWIRQTILQALAEQPRIVRIPLNRAGKALKIERKAQSLGQDLGRDPTEDEIAHAMKLSVADVREHRMYSLHPVSLDAQASEENEGTFGDLMPDPSGVFPDEAAIERDLQRDVTLALCVLDGRERRILRQYFGFGSGEATTLEAIGREMGLTRERVRQLKERAIGKIRASSLGEKLRSYLVA